MVRSLATLAFGLLTVFWATPGEAGLAAALGAYLLAVAIVQYWLGRGLAPSQSPFLRPALLLPAALAAVAVVVLLVRDLGVVAVAGGAALFLLGVGELLAGLSSERRFPLRNDWLISAVLGLGTGILLPLFLSLGAHAVLGVAGGGALMSGALWLLSALGMHHEGRRGEERRQTKAVN